MDTDVIVVGAGPTGLMRSDLLEATRGWEGRADIRTARSDDRPAEALLIRPDAYTAWAATAGEPADAAGPTLREALFHWFGAPLDTAVPVAGRLS